MQDITWYTDKVLIRDLKDYLNNPRRMSKADFERLVRDLQQDGYHNRILVNQDNTIIGGHSRKKAMLKAGFKNSDIIEVLKPSRQLTEDEFKRINVKDNLPFGEFDFDILGNHFDVDNLIDWGMPAEWLGKGEEEQLGQGIGEGAGSLAKNFMVPPFSVLNAREGWWQERKRTWLALGIKSEEGRKEGLLKMAPAWNVKGLASQIPDTSVFDPVLCELAYLWFSPPEGTVLDPFAGGSVRGIVAAKLGRQYVGVELREEQVTANRLQAAEIISDQEPMPAWHCDDSRNINYALKDVQADFILSCPPYADLEVYSDDPADLSTLSYKDFRDAYFAIIKRTCGLLKQDSFACFVVGEVRDKRGNYYNFIGDTIEAFRAAGLEYYNEAILVTCVGSLPIRAAKYFTSARKLGKTHQNFLVFIKGDPVKATKKCGAVDISKAIEAFGEEL